MVKIRSFLNNHWLLISILAIGLIFRLLFMEYQGLSNDELSGWIRTKPNTWNAFWWYGVEYGDMHPVFYQAFLWIWVRIFGDTEFSLRATGLLFYVLNSLLLYRICIRFYTKDTANLVLAVFAGLSFMIINTVFARPYNSGTFFLLLSFWSVLEINANPKIVSKWVFLLALGFWGAMLSHYAAFVTVGVLGIVSLFKIGAKGRIPVVIAGVLAVIGFLPHLSVTLFQLNRGGLGWLGAPDLDWLPEFFFEFLNRSGWHIFLLLLIMAFLWMKRRKIPVNNAPGWAFLVFFWSYVLIHVLSLVFTPVLRDTVMLFQFPFLFLFLFNNVELKKASGKIAVAVLSILIGLNSITHMHLLQPVNFPVFKEVAQTMDNYTKKYDRKNITFLIGSCNVEYLNYYSKYDYKESIADWSSRTLIDSVIRRVKNASTPYFSYDWTNVYSSPMVQEIIRRKFPVVVDRKTWFNCSTSLYSVGDQRTRYRKYITNCASSTFPLVYTSDLEFIGDMRINVEVLRGASYMFDQPYFLVETKAILPESGQFDFIALLNRDGEAVMNSDSLLVGYQGVNTQLLKTGDVQQTIYLAFEIQKEWLNSDEIKIYLHNPSRGMFTVAHPNLYVIDPSR